MPSDAEYIKINCPHCQAVSDFDFPFCGRTYYRCPSCDLIFASQKVDIKATIAYYRDLYFDNEAEDQISGRRTNIYRQIIDIMEDYKNPGSLLDVGCGCGFFLKEARERGWQVLGVDPSRKSIDHARSLIGDAVVCGTLDDVPADRRLDAIALINVLDHMVDACRQLQKIQNLLAPNGILYLRFPNGSFHSFVMRISRMLSAERFVDSFLIFHEYAFTPKAIKCCLGEMGYTDIRVLNAPLTGGNFYIVGRTFTDFTRKLMGNLTWAIFKFMEKLSGQRWVWGPSLQVIARKGTGSCPP